MSALLTAEPESLLLPTPSACSYGTSDGRGQYAHRGTPSLDTLARRGMLATPCSRDYKGPTGTPTRGGRNLPRDLGQKTRCLSPRFVEWMMGLPLGWTEAPGSEPSVTPSSPNVPKWLEK